MIGVDVLATRADERPKADAPDRELARARLLERFNTLAEHASNVELAEILALADGVIARRP